MSLRLISLLLLLLSLSLPLSLPSPTVYELLPQFGLPAGLLPDSVTAYSLSDDGAFSVDLQDTCYIQFDYLVYYEKHISGVLKYGSITRLQGIQVRRFLIWLGVDEIRVDLPPADSIYFQVGFINKRLDVSQFRSVRSCRDKKKLSFELPAVDDIQMLVTE